MSDLIMVPQDQVENSGGNDLVFPSGPWEGTIDIVRSKGIPMYEGKPFAGYASSEGEVLSLQIGNNQALDGQVDIGGTKFFVDLPTEVGDDTLANIDTTTRSHPNWQLQKSAVSVTQLAIALGAAELVGENGNSSWAVNEEFVDNLRAGSYDGMQIGFSVRHSPGKGKNEGKTFANFEAFHSAD